MPPIIIKKISEFPISKSESWKMFDEISPRYDLLNRILSFGLDRRWRRRMAGFLNDRPNQIVLDLATGTADVLLSLVENNSNVATAVGIDLAEKMLKQGRFKIAQKNLAKKIKLQRGDINELPFPNHSFDGVTIAFGIRNVPEPKKVLREMFRVLKPTGRALVLEFSLSRERPIRFFQLFYLRNIIPAIGFLFSGHARAYRYLNQTIEKFPDGKDFCRMMEDVGFKRINVHPLFLQTATIYQGDKA